MQQRPRPRFGLYLYGWYDAQKWQTHRHPHTPQIGYYDSSDPLAVRWQVDQMARLGIDYVIFEMVPVSDHSFDQCIKHAELSIPLLQAAGIGYTFLFDMFVIDGGAEPLLTYRNGIAELSRRGLLQGIFARPNGTRPFLTFAALPQLVEQIVAETPRFLSHFGSIWNTTWGRIHVDSYDQRVAELLMPYWRPALDSELPYSQAVEPLGYIQFWQKTQEALALNGFAAVSPGYDDLMLERDPQLAEVMPRRDGQTLVEQFRAAAATGAEDILIYGWNEYFEATEIEPTLEHGDFYADLMRRLIAQARAGEAIHLPPECGTPEPAVPLYLSDALQRSAQRYADRVPRWGFADYLAEVRTNLPVELAGDSVVLRTVSVTNTGDKPWPLASEAAPIRLGIRLADAAGAAIREGRAQLSDHDIVVGETVAPGVSVDASGLPPGRYQATLGVVWEGRMWFAGTTVVEVVLPELTYAPGPDPMPNGSGRL